MTRLQEAIGLGLILGAIHGLYNQHFPFRLYQTSHRAQ